MTADFTEIKTIRHAEFISASFTIKQQFPKQVRDDVLF